MANKKSSWFILILVLAVAAAAVYILYKPEAESNGAQEPVNESAQSDEAPSTEQTVAANLMPEAWLRYTQATRDIQVLTPNQTLEFFVVHDPSNADVAYFATSAFDQEADTALLSIYQYKEATYEFERLYKKTYAEGSVEWLPNSYSLPRWNVVGYDQGKLVVLMQDVDNSPGPCAEPLLVGVDNEHFARLFMLDLKAPSSGLSPYVVSQTLLDEAEARQAACLDEMG